MSVKEDIQFSAVIKLLVAHFKSEGEALLKGGPVKLLDLSSLGYESIYTPAQLRTVFSRTKINEQYLATVMSEESTRNEVISLKVQDSILAALERDCRMRDRSWIRMKIHQITGDSEGFGANNGALRSSTSGFIEKLAAPPESPEVSAEIDNETV